MRPKTPTLAAPLHPATTQLAPFRLQFSSTLRGARLARLLAVQHLAEHGIKPIDPTSRAVATVVAEFAANAITHGRTPGRDFEVRLALAADLVRIEVADTRPDRFPRTPADGCLPELPSPYATSGRGLLLVAAHADRWDWFVRDNCTKTVWAEVARR
ncbi:ATP-binding protein [Streptomyces sp. NPDC057136]|uniref:ATP-binding protein n=1 Tax=Streptomyces sp. NPDC057136 TaxID=3346029 RepID=UPI003633530E